MLRSVSSPSTAVTFDLWGTLIFEFGTKPNSIKRRQLRADYSLDVLTALGESVEHSNFVAVLNTISEDIIAAHDEARDSSLAEWIESGLALLDRDLPKRIGGSGVTAVVDAIDRSFIESPPTLLDGSLDLLDRVRGRGVHVGLISNAGLTSSKAFRVWFEQIGLLDKFEYMAFSNDLAMAKPAKQIFELALNALETRPARALHVGDNMHADVAGAAAAGMSTVWVRGGIESSTPTQTKPDYAVDSVLELVPVVDRWLDSLEN